jgi:hypothetical protein
VLFRQQNATAKNKKDCLTQNVNVLVSMSQKGSGLVVAGGRDDGVEDKGRVLPTLEDVVAAVFIVGGDKNSNGISRDQKQIDQFTTC